MTLALRDGRTVELRPIRHDDEGRLDDFHEHLSPDTIRRRFFTPHPHLTAAELHRFTHVDGSERLALVAICDDEIVGVGRYESLVGTEDVEGAFVVRDDVQGLGLGSALVQRIAEEARAHGKQRLVAEVLPGNTAMLKAFRRLGPAVTTTFVDGLVEVIVPL